jgi:hypothetical protein
MVESDRYAKIVEWSDEDGCYVGNSPDLGVKLTKRPLFAASVARAPTLMSDRYDPDQIRLLLIDD